MPPRFSIVLAGNILFVAFVYNVLKSTMIDTAYSMLIHTLRIPVEIVLFSLFLQKQVPGLMTYKGSNFDIVIGVSAALGLISMHFFHFKPSKKMYLIWNVIGLIFLINIVLIGVLSAPLPIQQFSFDQPNMAVLNFPFTLLPSFVVPIVFLAHILTISQLLAAARSS